MTASERRDRRRRWLTFPAPAEYLAQRRAGLPAASALSVTRQRATPFLAEAEDIEGRLGDLVGLRFSYDGFELIARREWDPDADTSWLGEFRRVRGDGDAWDDRPPAPDAMLVHNRWAQRMSGDYLWFIPAPWRTYRDLRQSFIEAKAGKRDADAFARSAMRHDMDTLAEEEFYSLTVTAFRGGIELGRDSLSEIEYGYDMREVIVDHGMHVTAVEDARASLARLCPAAAPS
jgi:hypothetical protein